MHITARRYALISLIIYSTTICALPDQPETNLPETKQSSPEQKSYEILTGWQSVLNVGLTYGGNELYTANYADGSSFNVKAGSLFQIGVGGLWQSANLPLAVQITLNYHSDEIFRNHLRDEIFNTNSSYTSPISFDRYPIETLAYYSRPKQWRIGGGLRFVISPKARGTSNNYSEELVFKNTVGLVAEVGIPIDDAWINFRIVSERYQPNTLTHNGVTTSVAGSSSVNGSHIGINVTIPLENATGRADHHFDTAVDKQSSIYSTPSYEPNKSEEDPGLISIKRNVQLREEEPASQH